MNFRYTQLHPTFIVTVNKEKINTDSLGQDSKFVLYGIVYCTMPSVGLQMSHCLN